MTDPVVAPSASAGESRKWWSFARNVLSLSSAQFVSYLIPLITLPYLTRTLGLEAWGQLAFYQALAVLFATWVNWGFPIFATNAAARESDNPAQLGRYLSNVILAQLFLLGIAAVAAIALAVWPESAAGDAAFLGAIWCLTASLVIFPSWMFQALELFRYLVISKIVTRLLPVPFIFLLVHRPDDAVWVIYLNALAALLVGVISLVWLRRRHGISSTQFDVVSALRMLRESSMLFLSSLATSIYTSLVPIVLGVLTSSAEVALYAIADRVRQLIANIFLPISQSLFPRMSFMLNRDRASGVKFLRIVSFVTIASIAAISTGVFVFAPTILLLLGGAEFADGVTVLRILAFVPTIVAISNMVGIQYLVPLGQQKKLNNVLIFVALLCLLIMYPVISQFGLRGASFLTLGSETLITALLLYIVFAKSFRRGSFS